MITKQASTTKINHTSARMNDIQLSPARPLGLYIDEYSVKSLQIDPDLDKNGNKKYIVWINNKNHIIDYDSTAPETLDFSVSGADGITPIVGSHFLIWAFGNNANTDFEEFNFTHKPYSAYTGPAAAAKGATITFTGLTSPRAYSFTVGARVAVRNTVGTAPQYEWNWGVVASIVSATSIQITMDNNSNYGVALTAATGGEIIQWDTFRPWVPTTSDQTLYKDNYRLIGEIITDTSTGNIEKAWRVDEEWRELYVESKIEDSAAPLAGVRSSAGRYIPLWSQASYVFLTFYTSNAGELMFAGPSASIHPAVVVRDPETDEVGIMFLTSNAGYYATSGANTTKARILLQGYRVAGGMRL